MNNKFALMICMILISLSFVAAVSIRDVSSSPAEVAPGEVINIIIDVKNIFEYDVTNLNVKLILEGVDVPFAPYQSSSEDYLDELDKDDREDFKFKLITLPSTRTGIYKIPVIITYNYEGENDTILKGPIKEELISVIVNSEPELKVSLDDSVVLVKGKENVVALKIINSGLSDVKFLYVGVVDAAGLKFLSEKEQYIGDINSDDFDSVDYSIFVKSDASSSITLQVTLNFMDATNKEFTETSNVVLKTYSLKEARGLGLVDKPKFIPYIVVGVFVIGFFVRRYLKKRKFKKSRR